MPGDAERMKRTRPAEEPAPTKRIRRVVVSVVPVGYFEDLIRRCSVEADNAAADEMLQVRSGRGDVQPVRELCEVDRDTRKRCRSGLSAVQHVVSVAEHRQHAVLTEHDLYIRKVRHIC